MTKSELRDKEGQEEVRERKKAQPIYDQLKQAAEPEDSRADQAEAILRLQQTYGNRYVQRLAASQPRMGIAPSRAQANFFQMVSSQDRGERFFGANALASHGEAMSAEGEDGGLGQVAPILRAVIFQNITRRQGGLNLGTNYGGTQPYHTPTYNVVWHPGQPPATVSGYEIEVTVDTEIRWDIQDCGSTRVRSADDPCVTSLSWSQIVYDLTPSKSPPRKSPQIWYWCPDLVERHELYHCRDYERCFNASLVLAQDWLDRQEEAICLGDARLTARTAYRLLRDNVDQWMWGATPPPCEVAAYEDGAPHYESRANDVQTLATGEGWPPASVVTSK